MSTDDTQHVRVLYLEDEFDQALRVKAFFGNLPGYAVTHVQDGDQGLELIDGERWDLLVTDLNLPGTDGFTVIRKMRSISAEIPILVTTGYTQAEYEEQALRAGADQVMIKPLDATTGLDLVPLRFVDVGKQMVKKMEALSAYQSVGAPRVDLRPRMAQAYARYWGRFMDFCEVEAFEQVKEEP